MRALPDQKPHDHERDSVFGDPESRTAKSSPPRFVNSQLVGVSYGRPLFLLRLPSNSFPNLGSVGRSEKTTNEKIIRSNFLKKDLSCRKSRVAEQKPMESQCYYVFSP